MGLWQLPDPCPSSSTGFSAAQGLTRLGLGKVEQDPVYSRLGQGPREEGHVQRTAPPRSLPPATAHLQCGAASPSTNLVQRRKDKSGTCLQRLYSPTPTPPPDLEEPTAKLDLEPGGMIASPPSSPHQSCHLGHSLSLSFLTCSSQEILASLLTRLLGRAKEIRREHALSSLQ